MTEAVTPQESEQFRAAIQRHLGLYFDDTKLGFLGEVLQRRVSRRGRSTDEYLADLTRGAVDDELAPLAQDLTVSETYFFRNIEQFIALREIVLPERVWARDGSRTLRLLSAACSSGEEAYTLAIILKEANLDAGWNISLRAVDINPSVLTRARRARYSGWAMRETPDEMKRRWFRIDDRELVLNESVRDMVAFDIKNLAVEDPELWPPEHYDVIFCRNAMMYFAPDKARALVERIAQSLVPGGYLFLGHAETLRGVSDAFHLRHTNGTFYYQRKEESPARHFDGPPPRTPAAVMVAPLAAAPNIDDSWFDTIRHASERIEALALTSGQLHKPSEHAAVQPKWDLGPVFELLKAERFTEALSHMDRLPEEAEGEGDILLVKAMLLAHSGDFTGASVVCERLLQRDEFNAGAHYVLAICREGLGDRNGAVEHDRVAIYLDAAFAMPRLHVGLLARRAGERETARRELARALTLLRLEDASRLLLFGGGFSRHSLIAMCESALRDCGGQP